MERWGRLLGHATAIGWHARRAADHNRLKVGDGEGKEGRKDPDTYVYLMIAILPSIPQGEKGRATSGKQKGREGLAFSAVRDES